MNMSIDRISKALHVTTEQLVGLKTSKMGVGKDGEKVPLKTTINHMAGKKLTKKQIAVNEKLSGMTQSYYVETVIRLIESNLIDQTNEKLLERLEYLKKLLLD